MKTNKQKSANKKKVKEAKEESDDFHKYDDLSHNLDKMNIEKLIIEDKKKSEK